MNTRRSLLILTLSCSGLTHGQEVDESTPEHDPVLKSILEDDSSEPSYAEPLADAPDENSEITPDETDEPDDDPLLVTGKPPEDVPELLVAPENQQPAAEGVEVEVAPGQHKVQVKSDQIDIVAPFPAKLLASPPAGWKVIHPDHTPEKTQSITLSNDQTIELAIRPHLLVPDADGAKIFALHEPGFDPADGYNQHDTIGSVLADSIHQLDRQDARLSEAATRLSELLDSLPPMDTVDSTQDETPNRDEPTPTNEP